jgi:hypothetical protein
MSEQYKLGWINATIRKLVSPNLCYQLTISYPVRMVQRFKTRQECIDILLRLEKQRKLDTRAHC